MLGASVMFRLSSGVVCYDGLGAAAAGAVRVPKGGPMRHHRLIGLVVLGSTPLLIQATPLGAQEPTIPFDDARLEIEFNATDGDAGFQIFADAEEWKQFEIFRPDGRRIVNFRTDGNLNDFGLTELFSESSEPPFTELPFAEFKRLFPAGNYRFEGETIDGRELASTVRFSHRILTAPRFIQPHDGGTLPANNAVIRWAPVRGAVDYEVIVTQEGDELVLDVTLSPEHTSLTVPPEFIDPGVSYQIEVHASAANGNRIFSQVGFTAT